MNTMIRVRFRRLIFSDRTFFSDGSDAQRQRPRPTLSNLNGNHRRNPPKPANDHAPLYNNNESKTTYRRPRPAGHSMVPVQS